VGARVDEGGRPPERAHQRDCHGWEVLGTYIGEVKGGVVRTRVEKRLNSPKDKVRGSVATPAVVPTIDNPTVVAVDTEMVLGVGGVGLQEGVDN
jgi:hypothetical protein